MKKKYDDNCFLKILSRHPSHSIMRRRILLHPDITGCVRFGSTTEGEYDIQINSVEAVQNCADKLIMKKLFKNSGVTSPVFYENHEEIIENYDFNKPILAKRSKRSKGAGMFMLRNIEEFTDFCEDKIKNNKYNQQNPYYFEVFYNYIKEYRIHVSKLGGYFYTNRKMLLSDTPEDERWYRNDSNSVWMLESNELFDKPETWDNIVTDCQLARESVGLDICSFDVKVNKKGQHMILEANSASSFGVNNDAVSIVATKYQHELISLVQKWQIQ